MYDFDYNFFETFRYDYEYELDCEYDFLETFRFDYEYTTSTTISSRPLDMTTSTS